MTVEIAGRHSGEAKEIPGIKGLVVLWLLATTRFGLSRNSPSQSWRQAYAKFWPRAWTTRFFAIYRVIGKCFAPFCRVLWSFGFLMLAGCSNMELFNPKGDIGEQEKNLILLSLGLMLLVVIPVILLTLYFAWRYRASNPKATYAPDWSHSTAIEVVVWTIPCIIVAFLAVIIWQTTHSLDPYRPLKADVAPVRVDVIALNWKWLFIYPDYGVASVNRLAIPVNTPVDFKLTSESIMNSFFIPELGSQIYAMAGMQTQLHLIASRAGLYAGRSSAFSGAGFSDMHFDTVATSRQEFEDWIRQAKKSLLVLNGSSYKSLALPSTKASVTIYSNVDPGLFDDVVNQFMSAQSPPADQLAICTTQKTKLRSSN